MSESVWLRLRECVACADQQLLKQSSLLCLLFNAIRHKTGILSFFFDSFSACARNSWNVSQRRPIVYLLVTEASYCVLKNVRNNRLKPFCCRSQRRKTFKSFRTSQPSVRKKGGRVSVGEGIDQASEATATTTAAAKAAALGVEVKTR